MQSCKVATCRMAVLLRGDPAALLLHGVTHKRHPKLNNKNIKHKRSVLSLCALVIAGKKASRLNSPLLRDENKVEGVFF